MNKLILKRNEIYYINNKKVILDYRFERLMLVYNIALEKMKQYAEILQNEMQEEITNLQSRIKTPQSIIQKMEKKGYTLTYKLLIDNINDIAGLRIVCISEKDIYKIVRKISENKEINILKKKDYIKKPKKSGYSAYHIIVEVPVYLEKNKIFVKVEIQIRTMAMDFWANIEHRAKYKPNSIVSTKDSNKLKIYAKIISKINKKMLQIYNKNYQNVKN